MTRVASSTALVRRRILLDQAMHLAGLLATATACIILMLILVVLFRLGIGGFVQTQVELTVRYDRELLGLSEAPSDGEIASAQYAALLAESLQKLLDSESSFGRRERRASLRLLSQGAEIRLRDRLLATPSLIDTSERLSLPLNSQFDQLHKGKIARDQEPNIRRISEEELAWFDTLVELGHIETRLSRDFFFSGDSRSPELAGIASALIGSGITILICFLLAFPLGVGAAVYLEEFAPKNRATEFIEVSINNLAAVPSIIFGLLGLAVFINFFGMPRSTPLVGGTVLALMTLPTIIIACRSSLKAVPPSIRYAALAMGATPVQATLHHVVPAALPGTLTGTIIGLSQALGETAPLIMIGMVAFIVDIPTGPTSFSSALPVQIYLWAENPERGFVEKTSAAILVMLTFLISMNAVAVYLRKRWERKW